MESNVTAASEVVREVGIMTKPTARFVSLVSHGANQTPFTMIKNEKQNNGGSAMATRKIIQAILVPTGMDTELIKAAFPDVEINLEAATAFSISTKYEQIKEDVIKDGTMELLVIDAEKGIKAIIGEAKEESLITKIFKKQAVPAIEVGAEESTVSTEEIVKSMGYEVYEEFSALGSIIQGVLGQENGELTTKVATIRTAFDNFMLYIQTAVKMAKNEPIIFKAENMNEVTKVGKKISQATLAGIQNAIAALTALMPIEDETDDEPKNEIKQEENTMEKQEVTDMIKEALTPVIEQIASLATKLETPPADTPTAPVVVSVEDFEAVKTELAKTKEDLEALKLSGTTHGSIPGDGDTTPVTKKEKGVYDGLLFREV